MVLSKVIYQGEKHCELTHGPSGAKFETDAPKDNNGRGESFSPTDLVAAALGACALTVMAIDAEKNGLTLKGSHCSVEKEMVSNPRRIGGLKVNIHLPQTLKTDERKKLEQIALTCPVKESLNANIQIPIEFHYSV